MQKGLYIYCITDMDKGGMLFCKGGIENIEGDVYKIQHRDIFAIVSEAEIKQFKPTRRNNMIHESIIEKAMENGSVLPFRFGVVANNNERIVNLLIERYDYFKILLEKVKGMIEVGVKVTYVNINDILKSIGDTNQHIVRLKQEKNNIAGNQAALIEAGKIIEKELNTVTMNYRDDIFERLMEFSEESVINDNLSNEMVMNASFLIPDEKESEFDEMLCELDENYEGKLYFKYSGPFPPYNFVNIKL